MLRVYDYQIKSSSLSSMVTKSPELEAHVLCVRAFRLELKFRSAGFEERGKPEYPEENLSEQRREPTTNLAHIWSELRIEPGPHRWEASALTTAPALLPASDRDCANGEV